MATIDRPHLTPRESEVLRLLAAGRRPREIAAEMCVTLQTVRAHMANARRRAEARTTIELAAKVERGEIRIDESD